MSASLSLSSSGFFGAGAQQERSAVSAPTQPIPAAASSAPAPQSGSAHDSDTQSAIIKQFLTYIRIKKKYDDSIEQFKSLQHNLASEEHSFETFQKRCCREGQFRSLPPSMKANFKDKVKFTAVEKQSEFYKKELAEIAEVEVESSKKVYDIILRGKQRFLQELRGKANSEEFIRASVASYEKHVREYGDEYARKSQKVNSFPVQEAIDHFRHFLSDATQRYTMHMAHAAQTKRMEEKKEEEIDEKAQEHIVGGAIGGDTLNLLIEKSLNNHMRKWMKEHPISAISHSNPNPKQPQFTSHKPAQQGQQHMRQRNNEGFSTQSSADPHAVIHSHHGASSFDSRVIHGRGSFHHSGSHQMENRKRKEHDNNNGNKEFSNKHARQEGYTHVPASSRNHHQLQSADAAEASVPAGRHNNPKNWIGGDREHNMKNQQKVKNAGFKHNSSAPRNSSQPRPPFVRTDRS